MPKAVVQRQFRLQPVEQLPEPRPRSTRLTSTSATATTSIPESSNPMPKPRLRQEQQQLQQPEPRQRRKRAGAAIVADEFPKPSSTSGGRQQLARVAFEVGSKGWSVGNSNRLDYSANNPDDDEEEADFDETKLSPFYDGYNTRKLLEKWRDLPPRLTMSDWAFYVKTTRKRSQRSQVDKLVADVCSKVLSMRELFHYSLDSGAHCLLWLKSSLAQRFINGMRKGCHIIGRIQGDVMVKDKQNLSNFMADHQFKEWIECGPHVCLNEKNEEIKRNLQRICRHQYTGHYMGKCTDETADKECPNFDYYFCECFRRHFFIPEFFTFSHYYLMEEFLKKYETDVEFQRTTWLAKPAYLTSSKGFFLIRDAREFRYFYLVRSDTCVRREGFILQRYLTRPCTINSHKMDCRMYLLLTVTNGRRVSGFFHPGYVRTTSTPYTVKLEQTKPVSGNIFEHTTATDLYKLANAKMPGDSDDDDDDDEKKQCIPFNEACEQITTGAKKVKKGEVEVPMAFANEDEGPGGNLPEKEFEKFHWRFKYIIEVLCSKMDPMVRDKAGTFQIFGLDILIDSDAKPWLLEINSHVATEQVYDTSQCKVISNVVTEAICIMCEMFQKSLQEELIAIEIQQGDQRLSKLSRSQRMMTAKAEQEALDKLQVVLDKTEISKRRPPVFMQNFFWWYDTPRYRWLKPWVLRKKPTPKVLPWHSRVFLGLASRNDAIRRKNFKADEMTASHDAMDYFRHIFWREKLENDMRRFEVEKLTKRAEVVASGGASAPGAGTSVAGSGGGGGQHSIAGNSGSSKGQQQKQQEQQQGEQPQSTSNINLASVQPGLRSVMTRRSFTFDPYQNSDEDDEDRHEDGSRIEVDERSALRRVADERGGKSTDDGAFDDAGVDMKPRDLAAGFFSEDLGKLANKSNTRRLSLQLPSASEVLNEAEAANNGLGSRSRHRRFRARFADDTAP
ncbi:hypothetical protein BOX15_Mlig013225g1 [Macrostomum lignano]|uniref:Tubulin--tyrosine ligase-like protein 9 n=1 Tax=Macrostomum lignano TaxID=282301 RepID=A0A267H975_9PLAT|nr:hypothetical protein BOX15_Mlig013225g1 [Macrostomum lignano]